jgi:glycosyltransferase involved in cell wall biosynthesis
VNFNGNFGGISMWVAFLACINKRIVWYRRSTNAFKSTMLRNLYNDLSNYLVNKFSTHILSNSFAAIDFFFGKNKLGVDNRFNIIPNGINVNEYLFLGSKLEARIKLGIPTNKFVIGHVGRFDPSKNHETLFKVIQVLKSQKKDFVFLFCGKDTDNEKFRSKLVEYEITDAVISIGLSNQLNLVYKAMDLFIFPSVTEGQPNALLEALSSGIPFFASDISPIKELIPEFSYKYLFSPKEVDQIAELIIDELNGKINRSDKLKLTNTMVDLYNQEKHYNSFVSIINE